MLDEVYPKIAIMKRLMDLIIESKDIGLLKGILKQIIGELNHNWKYRRDLVFESANNANKGPDEIGCFEYPGTDGNSVFVWMVIWQKELKIVNIVKQGAAPVTPDDYNKISDVFFRHCVEPVIRDKEVRVTITTGVSDIRKLAGEYTYEALLNWEKHYSPALGNAHSDHFRKWADFVCTAFDEGSQLSSVLLQRWLIDERKWRDDEVTQQVAVNYGYGLSILEYYDENY